MTTTVRTTSTLPRIFRRYTVLVVLYIAFIWLLPPSQQTMQAYELDSTAYRVLMTLLALPTLIAWLAAFIGYGKLHDYATSVVGTPEGKTYRTLANGGTWLAWSLVLPPVANLVLTAISYNHPDFRQAAIIITTYISVLVSIVALTIIGSAARMLTRYAGISFGIAKARMITAFFSLAGLMYCYLSLTHFDTSSLTSTDNPYYLPLWLMLLSVIIPNLFAWFTGLLAAYEILLISKRSSGLLYRHALTLLAAGLLLVVLSAISLQYVTAISPRTGYLVLNYKILLVVSFRVLAGLGFVFVAYGADKLKRIEEV